jgi:hypothetical protein
MSIEDPIVTEVRESRERLLADAGGFDEYVKRLKVLESVDASRLVTHVVKHDESPMAIHCAEDSAEYSG